jgi:alpha-1,6-mannosyltransferase
MKIVQAATVVAPGPSGLRTALGYLAEGYAAAGHQVVQLVPGPTDGIVTTPWGQIRTVRAPVLPGTGHRVIAEPRRLRRLLDQLAPDRLEVSDRSGLGGLGGWARRSGVTSVAISHERLDRLTREWLPRSARGIFPIQTWADHRNRSLAESFDTVVSTTAWAAEEFVRIGAARLRLVPLGVDLEEFRPDRRDAALRLRLGARPGELLLVHASRLSPDKRSDLALKCLSELLQRNISARLVIAGGGPFRADLQQQAAGLPVTFLGTLERARLATLLATADVVLTPGPRETFGLTALEALASGTPIVVNRGSALRELIAPGCGVAVAGTGWTMADGVEELLGIDPTLRRGTARFRAECFPWSASVSGFLAAHQLPNGLPAAQHLLRIPA